MFEQGEKGKGKSEKGKWNEMKPTDLEHRHLCQEQPQSGEAQASHPPGLLDLLWPPILCTPALFTHIVGHGPD